MTEPIVNEEPVIETPVPPVPGTQTDPALLLKSLQDEREKRRLAEQELKDAKIALSEATKPNGEFSDEGKVLLGKISALEGVITTNKQNEVLKDLQTQHPALKDKSAEFETFRNDPNNAGMSMNTAARAFLIENNLVEQPAPRRGVERPAGGARTPAPVGMTADEIDNLRMTNYRKYSDMIRNGEIK